MFPQEPPALIAGLLVRRRRTEDSLRVSYQRNQDLAGRLIAAQEAERGRIPRDLHDDSSQELASLSMSLILLKARVSRSGADGDRPLADRDAAANGQAR